MVRGKEEHFSAALQCHNDGECVLWRLGAGSWSPLPLLSPWQLRASHHFQSLMVVWGYSTDLSLLSFIHSRLFNSRHDAPYIENYPRLLYYTKIKRRPCHACAEDATWITCDDELAPESPCFFCHSCFVKLHYSTDNEKMCQFKAYRYQVPNPPLLPYYWWYILTRIQSIILDWFLLS